MRHSVLLEALEYSSRKKGDYFTDIRAAPPFLVVSRQTFNALSPLIVGHKTLLRLYLPRNFTLRLLMRADTFRFATSVVIDEQCTTDQARAILSRMDVVLHVDLPLQSDALVPLLLRLPHLRTVESGYAHGMTLGGMTYAGTVQPLLRHRNESVRRHVAQYVPSVFVSRHVRFSSVIRDDIIPLLDSATTNGAISDYLRAFPSERDLYWGLSRDVVCMLCTRMFSYLISPTAHEELLEHSLVIFCHCVNRSLCEPHWELDVLAEWPVLDRVLELYRSRRLRSSRSGALSLFGLMLAYYTPQFYDAGVLEVLCEGIQSPTQLLDKDSALGSLIDSARRYSSLQLLETSIPQTLLRYTLLPLHHRVMSRVLRLRRCGVDEEQALKQCRLSLSAHECREVDLAVRFFLSFLSDLAPKRFFFPGDNAMRAAFHRVVHLLLDEEQFHLGPILRTALLTRCLSLAQEKSLALACEDESGVTSGDREFWNCSSHEFAASRRRIREEFGTQRFYLAEFCEDRKVRSILWEARTTYL